MRNNKEFRELVDKKHKSMLSKQKDTRKRSLAFVSCFMVCVIICGVFFANDGFKKIQEPMVPLYTSDSGDASNDESRKESLQNSSELTSSSAQMDSESKEDQSSEQSVDISFESPDISQPNVTVPDVSVPDISVPDESTGNTDHPTPLPPITEIYEIVPDDFPNITETVDLMQYLTKFDRPCEYPDTFTDTETRNGIADFSFELFKNTYSADSNNLLSPTSALYALAMLTNGAHGNTKDELINTLCGTSIDRLNEYLSKYRTLFGQGNGYNTSLDSAVWYDKSVTVDKNFLQTNCDYYGMEAYKTVFDTQDALDSVNGWIEEKTNGLITEMIEKFEPNTAVLIANTVYFEASWIEKMSLSTRDNFFTNASKQQKTANVLSGEASTYLKNENCIGFKCNYESKYSFIALLPNENMSIEAFINTLNANTYYELFNTADNDGAYFLMPKFESSAEIDLADALKSMGINNAFSSSTADFSRMAICDLGNMYIKKVAQNSKISVHEEGTLAASSTVVMVGPECAPLQFVELNRPFVYLIIDNTTNLPIFIGTVEDI